MATITATTRLMAAGSAAALIAAGIVAAHAAPAAAGESTVSDADGFATAIEDADLAGDEDWIITIDSNFTWDRAPVEYGGTGNITIYGGSNTVTLGDSSDGLLAMDTHEQGDIWISDLTITGGTPNFVLDLDGKDVALWDVEVTDMETGHTPVAVSASDTVGIYDCLFEDLAAWEGVVNALWAVSSGDIYIDGGHFRNNRPPEGATWGAAGAASLEADGSIFVSGSEFDQNAATGSGGALASWSTFLIVADSVFTDNEAVSDGGAIFAQAESVYIEASTFTDNYSDDDGGAVWSEYAFHVFRSAFANNEAADYAGAIGSDGNGEQSTIVSSTFHANKADYIGAVYIYGDSLEVGNSTFTENEANSSAAHIYLATETLEVFGSVFADGEGGFGCYADWELDSDGYNFDDTGDCTYGWYEDTDLGFDDVEHQLGELGYNGGPTPTRVPAATSPLRNQIPFEVCDDTYNDQDFADFALDQRGSDRIDVAWSDGGCDIGAVEVIGSVSFTLDGLAGTVEVTVDGAYQSYGECKDVEPLSEAPPGAPAGIAFPHGLLSFCVANGYPGATVTVTMTFPSPITHAFKVDDGWVAIPGATIAGTTLVYQITDGGSLDRDGEPDGYIVDPVAAGVGALFTG